ncbi:MAG: TonB-dependent receptor, partial [Deltaproteobacteria bacterium]|nr:TonB-dependent receptor [Deltaproteobacteria bacterium]
SMAGHHPLGVLERVEPGQKVEVRYFLERDRHARYRSIVWGTRGRSVVGRTSLVDAEIYEVPGTLGDPFRVVMLLPGVASSVSGLSYPIVRGALPGDSRYEVDGVQVPLLYHLLLGTAVVNPRLTTGLTFEPGGYSVEHGGFPGVLIAAKVAAPPQERVTAADVSLIQASVYHAQPLTPGLQTQVAARYGTLGLIIEAIASEAVLRFWDYQAKVDWQAGAQDQLQLLAFGAGNAVGKRNPDGSEDLLTLGFHRGLVRWKRTAGTGWLSVEVELGQEGFTPPGEEGDPRQGDPGRGAEGEGELPPGKQPGPGPGELPEEGNAGSEDDSGPETADYRYVGLRLKAAQTPLADLELRGGAEATLQDFRFVQKLQGAHVADDGLTLGAWLEAEWSPGRWTIVPGVRVDHYRYGLEDGPRETSLDPRISLARELAGWLTLKASLGVHHGPPRVTIAEGPLVVGPVPGMMGIGLDHGLSRSVQLAGGVVVELPWKLEATLQGYHAWLHTAIDFSLMGVQLEQPPCRTLCQGDPGLDPGPAPPADPPPEGGEAASAPPPAEGDAPPPTTAGRSYGLELLLRRRLGEALYGWLSYSLARSEREVAGHGTLPFAFDQTHVLNLVLSWEVGRHWTLGAALHAHSGRPYTPTRAHYCGDPRLEPWSYAPCDGEPLSGRLPPFWRLDLRVQKRELFDTWYFDFYVDVINVTFNKEVVGYSLQETATGVTEEPEEVPIFIPMLGLRGQF